MRTRVVLVFATLLWLASDASAMCFKCRDQACFGAEGRAGWCTGITNGCFSGGTCNGHSDGDECGLDGNPCNVAAAKPLSDEWQLARVDIVSPTKRSQAVRVAQLVHPGEVTNCSSER